MRLQAKVKSASPLVCSKSVPAISFYLRERYRPEPELLLKVSERIRGSYHSETAGWQSHY